ncbi:MAG: HAD family phosphatase [Anaerolineae bacterium]|nr:HAD family phosphatase [Anaerolineae bacterium]
MAKIQAVIFDFGGVLVRMVDDRPRQELAQELGVTLARLDELVFSSVSAQRASKGEISVDEHWESVREALHLTREAMPAFLEKYWSADDVNWELLKFIRELHPHYKVGVLSNAWDNLRQTMHERWGIDGLFDQLIISAEVKMIKPDPGIFHLAVKRLGVQPSETVFIDDMLENIEAARKEGLCAILHRDTNNTITALRDCLAGR